MPRVQEFQDALAPRAEIRPNSVMTDGKPDLHKAYAVETPSENRRLYADWAETYDTSFAGDMDYQLPSHVARVFTEVDWQGPVLDLGAGTGLCGQSLAALAVTPIDGTDISQEMLDIAATKGVYRHLFSGDLTAHLPVADGTYAGVVSSGTFTHGHVGPEALDEVLRIAAPGGWISLSINATHWQKQGFDAAFDRLSDKITERALIEVEIYGAGNTTEHRKDTGLIARFQKR